MKINEGYKSAVSRYNSLTNSNDGRKFVSILNRLGIPREHLLWAVERIEGEGINVHVFIQMYKEWKKYVFPYCEKQNIDIPNITQQTFQQMCTMIDTSKRYWAFPNVVYNHNGITVCKLNTYTDAHMLPIETTWCITKMPQRFEEFCGEGKDGYYIVNNSAQEPYQKTLAIIMNGEVEYWDSNNKRMADLPDYIARFKEYEALLPKEVKEIFYSDAAKQGEQIEQQNNKTDKNESKNMNRKNTIRLTESELKQIITESVRNIISELDWKTYANAASAAKDRESIFKDDPGYPYRPMVRHYKDDGSLDMEKYQRDSDWQVNQSKQPEKFRQAAYRELSREICGEDDFALFLAKYIPLHGVDDKLQKMLQQYQEGEKYIKNNKTQWSKRR